MPEIQTPQPAEALPSQAADLAALPPVQIERGTCWVLFAHDIGMSIDLNQAERRITDDKHRETMRHKRRAPQYFEYHPAPLRVMQAGEPLQVGDYQTAGNVEILLPFMPGIAGH